MMFCDNFSQLDVRWRDLPMGTQGGTIGSQGCTLTTIANAVKNFEIFKTPAELLSDFNAAGVLDDGGFIFWPNVTKAIPGVYFHYRYGTTNESAGNLNLIPTAAIEKIKKLLLLGYPVPLKTMTPAGQHWVLAVDWSTTDDDARIIDPAGGTQVLFGDKYGPLTQKLYALAALIGDPVGSADGVDASFARTVALGAGKACWKAKNPAYSGELVDTFL